MTIITQGSSFKIETEEKGGMLYLRFSGAMDEDVPFGAAFKAVGDATARVKALVLDLGDVREMNSFGIRGWIHFLGCLQALHEKLPYRFLAVNGILIERASMFDGLLGENEAPIDHVMSEYYCDACGCTEDFRVDAKNSKLVNGAFVPPAQKCPKCSSEMQFAGIEDNYARIFSRFSSGT